MALRASDESISRAVAAVFTQPGVDVRTSVDTIISFEKEADDSLTLRWTRGGGSRAASSDAVIMATGWPAEVHDLGLDQAGIDIERSAVLVDRDFRTTVPHILAVGDANGWDMRVQTAQFEGEAVAVNAVLGTNPTPQQLLRAGWFTDPDDAGVGFSEADMRAQDVAHHVTSVPCSSIDRAVIDDREIGFLKTLTDQRRQLTLGAHVVGENAMVIIQSITIAMTAAVSLSICLIDLSGTRGPTGTSR